MRTEPKTGHFLLKSKQLHSPKGKKKTEEEKNEQKKNKNKNKGENDIYFICRCWKQESICTISIKGYMVVISLQKKN